MSMRVREVPCDLSREPDEASAHNTSQSIVHCLSEHNEEDLEAPAEGLAAVNFSSQQNPIVVTERSVSSNHDTLHT